MIDSPHKKYMMKKHLQNLFKIFLLTMPVTLFAQPNPVGWASQNGGTTGGFGGTTVIVTNRAEFINAVSNNDDPSTIFVQDTIELNLYEKVGVRSNKTIYGFTENAMIRFGGIEITGDNVIVQNLVIGDFYDGDPTGTTNSTDAITVYGVNVWIDHCWLWAGADGLLDIRSGNSSVADFVTVSYCRFSDHNKVTLVGSSDSNTQDRDHLRVTFHHCWYDGTVDKGVTQRMPRVRFGDVHIFNNYYEELGSYGAAARIESDVVIENTYFRNSSNPHIIDDIGVGLEDPDLVAINNVYELCSGAETTNGDAFVPADHYDYTPEIVSDVPLIVMNEAGPYNPTDNVPPTAVNDTIDYTMSPSILNILVTENDFDPDSDDLRLAQFVGEPNGTGYIRDNKIIYTPPTNATGIDTVAYSLVDTEGGVDTGLVLIFLDVSTNSTEKIRDENLLKIFPNPADKFFVIELLFEKENDFQVELSDWTGRNISNVNKLLQFQNQKLFLQTSTLATGGYFLSIRNGNKMYSKKIIVTH